MITYEDRDHETPVDLVCFPGSSGVVPWVAAGSQPGSSLDRKFQSAVAQYESGQFAQAAAQLEALVRQVPESFEVRDSWDRPMPRNRKIPKPGSTWRRPCA